MKPKARSLFLLLPLVLLASCTGYKVEDGRVYWHLWDTGSGKRQILVDGADATTFVVLKHPVYGKDAARCYFKATPIKGADPSTFQSINEFYARDAVRVYRLDKPIPHADSTTFEVLRGDWSRDAVRCYHSGNEIAGADPHSFRVIGGYLDSWARDDESYFHNTDRVPVADPASFRILDGGYSKDRLQVYYMAEVVEGADTETFALVKNTIVGRDKNGFFRFGKPFTPSRAWLRDVGL